MDCKKEKRLAQRICKTLDYRLEKVIRNESTGSVYRSFDQKKNCHRAIKISLHLNKEEEEEWGRLLHPYILPVSYTFLIDECAIGWQLPDHDWKIKDVVNSKLFKQDSNCYFLIKRWLYEVLCALKYLHRKGLHYLNLNTKTVLITPNTTSVLSDFGKLRHCKKDNLEMSQCCLKDLRSDMLSFGIFALELLTGDGYRMFIGHCDSSDFDDYLSYAFEFRYNFMRKFYDKLYFFQLLQSAYISILLSEREREDCWMFLEKFFNYDPPYITLAEEALKHHYLLPWNNKIIQTDDHHKSTSKINRRNRRIKSCPEIIRNELKFFSKGKNINAYYHSLSRLNKTRPCMQSTPGRIVNTIKSKKTCVSNIFIVDETKLPMTVLNCAKKLSPFDRVLEKCESVFKKFRMKLFH